MYSIITKHNHVSFRQNSPETWQSLMEISIWNFDVSLKKKRKKKNKKRKPVADRTSQTCKFIHTRAGSCELTHLFFPVSIYPYISETSWSLGRNWKQWTHFLVFRPLSLKFESRTAQVMQTFGLGLGLTLVTGREWEFSHLTNEKKAFRMNKHAHFHVFTKSENWQVSFVNNNDEVSWRTSSSKVNKVAKLNKLTFR